MFWPSKTFKHVAFKGGYEFVDQILCLN